MCLVVQDTDLLNWIFLFKSTMCYGTLLQTVEYLINRDKLPARQRHQLQMADQNTSGLSTGSSLNISVFLNSNLLLVCGRKKKKQNIIALNQPSIRLNMQSLYVTIKLKPSMYTWIFLFCTIFRAIKC